MSRMLMHIMAGIAAALLAATPAAHAQTTITMRSSAQGRSGAPVHIADVATVLGPEAARVGSMVVLPSAAPREGGLAFVDPSDVQAAIDAADSRFNWGRATLTGGRCYLALGERPETPGADSHKARPETPAPVGEVAGDTVRGEIVRRLASLYNVDPVDVRVGFGVLSPADLAFLDEPARPDIRSEIQLGSNPRSGRIPLRVDQYQRDRIVGGRTFNAEVLVRREVVLAAATIERDTPIGLMLVSTDRRWVTPDVEGGVTIEQVQGATARRRIDAGRVVSQADIQSPLVVQRGETVWVHCLAGNVAIKARARALAAGRDGQVVPMQMEGSKKTFMARMSGRGMAVMLADESPEAAEVPAELKPPAPVKPKPKPVGTGVKR